MLLIPCDLCLWSVFLWYHRKHDVMNLMDLKEEKCENLLANSQNVQKVLTSKPAGLMQSCSRWRLLVWFTRPLVVTSQINSQDPGKYLPELPNFMQYYTRHHVHVICTSSACAHRLHAHVICMLSAHIVCIRTCHLHIICSTPHGQRGPKLSFYFDRNWLLNGICCKNVELFHFRFI